MHIPLVLQLKERAQTQEKEMKDQLQSIQEEAQKQIQSVTTQLHSKSSQLVSKEEELADLQRRLEGEVEHLNQQLISCKDEAERSGKTLQEVRNYKSEHIW